MDLKKISQLVNTDATNNVYSIIAAVLTIIFMWKIFEKAGEKGWKVLIPVYNTYILFKLVWNTKMFWVAFFMIFVACIFASVSMININDALSGLCAILFIITLFVLFIIEVELVFNLGNAFGKGVLFNLGLLLLSVIFCGILAFDSSKYIGPKTK